MTEIVPMAQAQLPALAAIERACFSTPWSEQALREELHSDTAVFRVALVDGQVAGYAGMHFVCGEGYVDNIAVAPAFRRRGLGEALVRSLLTYVQTRSGDFLTLEVRESNAPALALYHKLGFVQEGRRPRFYRNPQEDALLLTRRFPHAQGEAPAQSGR